MNPADLARSDVAAGKRRDWNDLLYQAEIATGGPASWARVSWLSAYIDAERAAHLAALKGIAE